VVDEYHGELEGLRTAEVEFADEAASDAFAPPPWLGREITGDRRYANQALASRRQKPSR
jgi:CYTH domain-containing protein